jgi:hypothetical protein
MKSTWQSSLCWFVYALSLSASPSTAIADDDSGCFTFLGEVVVSRISKGVYEVQTRRPSVFCGTHGGTCMPVSGESVILKTPDEVFQSTGRIDSPVVARLQQKPLKMSLNNGFEKEFQVYHQDEQCRLTRERDLARERIKHESAQKKARAIAAESDRVERLKAAEERKRRQEAEALWK